MTDWVVGRLVSGVSFSQNPETIFVLGPGAIGTAAHSVGQSVDQPTAPRNTEPLSQLQHTVGAGFYDRAANCLPDIQRRGSTGDGCSTQRWPGSTAEQPTDSQTYRAAAALETVTAHCGRVVVEQRAHLPPRHT